MLQTVVWIQFLAQEFPHAADVIKKKITSLNWLYILLSRPWGNAVYKANVLPLVYIKKEELLSLITVKTQVIESNALYNGFIVFNMVIPLLRGCQTFPFLTEV